jgi:hypothetical protein
MACPCIPFTEFAEVRKRIIIIIIIIRYYQYNIKIWIFSRLANTCFAKMQEPVAITKNSVANCV